MDTPGLAERFDAKMRLRGYGVRTRKAYLGHARRFLQDASGGTDLSSALREHVLRKLRAGRMSRSYHSQLISALRLFCSTVLGRWVEDLPLERPRRDRRLPTVLSHEEFRRFLVAVRNPKHVAILAVAYSAGLRVREVVRLRPEDLDRDRGLIQVRGGKGRKPGTPRPRQRSHHRDLHPRLPAPAPAHPKPPRRSAARRWVTGAHPPGAPCHRLPSARG